MSQYKAGMTVLIDYFGEIEEVVLVGQFREMYPHKMQENPAHGNADKWAIIGAENSPRVRPDYWFGEYKFEKVICTNYVRGHSWLKDNHLAIKKICYNATVFPYKIGDDTMIIS